MSSMNVWDSRGTLQLTNKWAKSCRFYAKVVTVQQLTISPSLVCIFWNSVTRLLIPAQETILTRYQGVTHCGIVNTIS